MFPDISKPRNQETPRLLQLEVQLKYYIIIETTIEAGQGAGNGLGGLIYPERRHRPFGNIWQTATSSCHVPQHHE